MYVRLEPRASNTAGIARDQTTARSRSGCRSERWYDGRSCSHKKIPIQFTNLALPRTMKTFSLALTTAALLSAAWALADAIPVATASPSLRGLILASSRSLQSPPSQQLNPGESCYTHPPENDDHVAIAQVDCTPTLLGSCLGGYQCANDFVDAYKAGSSSCGTWAVWMASQQACDWAYVCCFP
jgi:hypothetical protein